MSSLATRQPKPEEKEIIDEVLDLYQLKPSEKAYSHYSETAVFHDPVSIAKGKKSIQSQLQVVPSFQVTRLHYLSPQPTARVV